MTDPERELRDALHRADLPAAPVTLERRLEGLAADAGSSRGQARRWPLALLAAALLVGGGLAVSGGLRALEADVPAPSMPVMVAEATATPTLVPTPSPSPDAPVAAGSVEVQRVPSAEGAATMGLGLPCLSGGDIDAVYPADLGRRLDERIAAAGIGDTGWIGLATWVGDAQSAVAAFGAVAAWEDDHEVWVHVVRPDGVTVARQLLLQTSDRGRQTWHPFESVGPCDRDPSVDEGDKGPRYPLEYASAPLHPGPPAEMQDDECTISQMVDDRVPLTLEMADLESTTIVGATVEAVGSGQWRTRSGAPPRHDATVFDVFTLLRVRIDTVLVGEGAAREGDELVVAVPGGSIGCDGYGPPEGPFDPQPGDRFALFLDAGAGPSPRHDGVASALHAFPIVDGRVSTPNEGTMDLPAFMQAVWAARRTPGLGD